MLKLLAFGAVVGLAFPVSATTFAPVEQTCPVGGKKFSSMAMMSTTTWGALPDGMPLGVGPNPAPLPQCPENGLVLYRDFDAASRTKLPAIVLTDTYQSQRRTETPRYLAYVTATALGDEDNRLWLLLGATWEAKNDGPAERAKRYMTEFVALAGTRPFKAVDFESIAIKARAANALRELGSFDEAEGLRASILIAKDAGGPDGADNRRGWTSFLGDLAAPIARKDASRDPIDMVGARNAAQRCLAPEHKLPDGQPAAKPLTVFEQAYCKRADIKREVAEMRKWMRD